MRVGRLAKFSFLHFAVLINCQVSVSVTVSVSVGIRFSSKIVLFPRAQLAFLALAGLVVNRKPCAGGLCSTGRSTPTCMIHRTALIHQKRGEWQGNFLAVDIGGRNHLRS